MRLVFGATLSLPTAIEDATYGKGSGLLTERTKEENGNVAWQRESPLRKEEEWQKGHSCCW